MATVLLIDSPREVRKALRTRLSLEPELAIVDETGDAAHAISLALALEPDVVLVDAEAANLDTPKLVHTLVEHEASWGIVVLTQHAVPVSRSLDGTSAIVVDKHEGLAALVKAIRSAGDSHRG
jgi:DNA-binding NarL/FixJ family response regulator